MYGVTRIHFLHTVFSFLTPPYDVQSWGVGCLSTGSNMIKKSWTVPNLGVIVFTHNRISRDIRLWEMRFSYLEIYSVYLEIYEYGKVVQGVRFPDGTYRYIQVRTGTDVNQTAHFIGSRHQQTRVLLWHHYDILNKLYPLWHYYDTIIALMTFTKDRLLWHIMAKG